ncbi:MAG TPA: DUF4783 domain-containing protein [Flavobacteriales bacterium]
MLIRSLLLSLSILFGGILFAQNEVKDQVVAAIGSGNAPGLSRHLVANVDLTVGSSSEYYSKAQAEQILRKFFAENEPQGLTIEHEGTSKVGDRYYIGRLKTAKGEYRVTFFLKKAEVFQVKQLRIEAGKTTP